MTTQAATSANSLTLSSKAAQNCSSPPWASHLHGRSRNCTKVACYSKTSMLSFLQPNTDKVHSGNMIGHPKHVHKACQAGADIIIAQGGEGGGHTGDIATSVLIPACADACRQYKSPLTGGPVTLVAAGGINDGRSVAAALMLGASGVWVGTRFIPSVESKAPKSFKEEYVNVLRPHLRTTMSSKGRETIRG